MPIVAKSARQALLELFKPLPIRAGCLVSQKTLQLHHQSKCIFGSTLVEG
jgi:hypothetical protein